jgi:hypothetical protein
MEEQRAQEKLNKPELNALEGQRFSEHFVKAKKQITQRL